MDKSFKELPCAKIALLNEEEEAKNHKNSITAAQSPAWDSLSFIKKPLSSQPKTKGVVKETKKAPKGMFTHLSPDSVFKPKIINMYKQSIQTGSLSKNQLFSKLAWTARKTENSLVNNSYQKPPPPTEPHT